MALVAVLLLHVAPLLLHGAAGASAPCADVEAHCFLWSTVGECERRPDFMLPHCALSCGTCSPGGAEAAADDEAAGVVVLGGRQRAERIPFRALATDPVVQLSAGELHLVLRLASGKVLTFGDDSMGQLGRGAFARRTLLTRRPPERVLFPPPHHHLAATHVDAGRMFSGALLTDGTLWLWGENTHSQCGVAASRTPMDVAPAELNALTAIYAVPLRLPLRTRVAAFSLGEPRGLALDADADPSPRPSPSF